MENTGHFFANDSESVEICKNIAIMSLCKMPLARSMMYSQLKMFIVIPVIL